MTLQDGIMRKYRLIGPSESFSEVPINFPDRAEALRFLRVAALDFDILTDLRHWAVQRGFGPTSDHDIIEYAAASLVIGELYVISPSFGMTGGGSATKAESAAPVEERSRRSQARDRTTPSAFRPPRPESSSESAPESAKTTDVAQQVSALLAAAQGGTPFCEQCGQAKQGRSK